MKPAKFITYLIAILFTLVVTTFIAFYSYGAVGGWTKNKEKFIDYYFSNRTETTNQIENAIKYSSSLYQKNVSNLKYTDNNGNELALNNGVLSLTDLSIESYAILYENDDTSTIQYVFYIYDISYGTKDAPVVNPKNLYLVTVPGSELEGDANLSMALKTLKTDIETEGTTGAATPAVPLSGTLAVYDKNFSDAENADKAHYVYSIAPNNTYTVKDDEGNDRVASVPFLKNQEVSFALVEKITGEEEEPFRVLVKGSLENIKSLTTGTNNLNFHHLEDLMPGYNGSFEKAGYLRFIWPTILWQSAIALAISGTLSFLFVSIWNIEETEKDKLKPKNYRQIKK